MAQIWQKSTPIFATVSARLVSLVLYVYGLAGWNLVRNSVVVLQLEEFCTQEMEKDDKVLVFVGKKVM